MEKTAYAGEIWEMEMMNGKVREVLLVQCFTGYATILTLTDTEPEENGLVIISRSKKWTDCGRLGYVFYDKLISMVRSLTDKEMLEVRDSIGEALSIQVGTFAELADAVASEATEESENATQQQQNGTDLPQEAAQLMMDSALELEGITKERDVYKHLYETLLDRVLCGK